MKKEDKRMNKNFALPLLALLYTGMQCATDSVNWFEIKPSYFFFTSSPLKDIYNKGGFEIQGSVSVPVWYCFDIYGSIGYRETWGHALNTCEKTSLTVIPIDIGIKPLFKLNECTHGYFAFGPRYFHLHQHNRSPYVDGVINGNGIGFFVNAGFNALVRDCLLLGIFGEYSYEKKKICPKLSRVYSNGKVQLGGLAFGVSIGRAF
jgi:hypothetical protein